MNPLYELLHKQVLTPKGKGTLLQAFDTRVAVDLGETRKMKDKQVGRVSFFKPGEISEAN